MCSTSAQWKSHVRLLDRYPKTVNLTCCWCWWLKVSQQSLINNRYINTRYLISDLVLFSKFYNKNQKMMLQFAPKCTFKTEVLTVDHCLICDRNLGVSTKSLTKCPGAMKGWFGKKPICSLQKLHKSCSENVVKRYHCGQTEYRYCLDTKSTGNKLMRRSRILTLKGFAQ